jgi:hypothetical protein
MESARLPVRVKSVEECTAGCRAMQRHDNENHFGYPYAGVEYLTECWCGDEPEEGFPFTWSYQCNMRCTGDYADWQNCGGYGAMSVWSTLPQDIDGICVGDAPRDNRVLHGGSLWNIYIEDLNPEKCKTECLDKDFRYYGVEQGDSCYCGNNVDRALRVSQPEECSIPCIGGGICGGDFRMNLYGPTFFDITANKVVFEHAVVHRWFDLRIDLKLNENFLFDKANIFGVTVAGEPYENAGSQIPALFLEPESMNLEVCMAINGANECGTLAEPITANEWTSLAFEQWCWFDSPWNLDWCSFHVFKLDKNEDGTEEWIQQLWWWNTGTTFENVEGVIGNTYGENFAVASGEYNNFRLDQYETRDASFLVDISAAPDQSLSVNAP